MTEPRLDESSAEPLHHQLQKIFIHKISSGKWRPGDRLDGEISLSHHYGVSRSTIRQALLELVNKQYLSRKQGKGTFVSDHKHDLNVLGLRFTTPTPSDHRLIQLSIGVTTPEIAEILNISSQESVTCIKRLRLFRDEPVAIEASYLSTALCPDIDEANLELPLVDILRDRYGITLTKYQTAIEPVILREEEKEQLSYSRDPALGLRIFRTGMSLQNTPLTYNESVLRGDRSRAILIQ